MAFDTPFLATPIGVSIRGGIPIIAKMAPQLQKNQVPTEVASEVAKCHPGFWGGIFGNFGKRIEKLQNSG